MPRPRPDLLQQMPHSGEDKVVKCLTNAREGGGEGGGVRVAELLDGPIILI